MNTYEFETRCNHRAPELHKPFLVGVELAFLFLDLQGFVTLGLMCPGYLKLDSNSTQMEMTEKRPIAELWGVGSVNWHQRRTAAPRMKRTRHSGSRWGSIHSPLSSLS